MRPYHWFQGSSVRELYDWIGTADPDTCRLIVRQDGQKMTFEVESEVSAHSHVPGHVVNDSHVCPPECDG